MRSTCQPGKPHGFSFDHAIFKNKHPGVFLQQPHGMVSQQQFTFCRLVQRFSSNTFDDYFISDTGDSVSESYSDSDSNVSFRALNSDDNTFFGSSREPPYAALDGWPPTNHLSSQSTVGLSDPIFGCKMFK